MTSYVVDWVTRISMFVIVLFVKFVVRQSLKMVSVNESKTDQGAPVLGLFNPFSYPVMVTTYTPTSLLETEFTVK